MMNVFVKSIFHKATKAIPLGYAVTCKLDVMQEGQLETAQAKADKCAQAIGELVGILADKGILSLDDAMKICDMSKSEEFIEEVKEA